MNLSIKDSQTYRTDLWLPRGRENRGAKKWEFGINKCNLLYILLQSIRLMSGQVSRCQLASIRQMSGQVSRGSAGEYQADEWAGIARTSWRLSVR